MGKVRMTIRIVSDLDSKLKQISENKGISKNALIVQACWEFVRKNKIK